MFRIPSTEMKFSEKLDKNEKKAAEYLRLHNKERRLLKFNIHMIHRREGKTRKAVIFIFLLNELAGYYSVSLRTSNHTLLQTPV